MTDSAADKVVPAAEAPSPALEVGPSPHAYDLELTTRSMMRDVLLALVPPMAMAVYVFGWRAVLVVAVTTASCLAAEEVFMRVRGVRATLGDLSAAVTGIILGLTLPATCPWWVAAIAGFVAIGIGKTVFGSLGQNVFNPAMVGRAFVMISFSKFLGAPAYQVADAAGIISQATPLTLAREAGAVMPEAWPMLLGMVNGSLGETSTLACVLGGLYLCARRTASWEIPLGVIGGVVALAALTQVVVTDGAIAAVPALRLTVLEHVAGGALAFGAFFIATDPVTSPITRRGKLYFGLGIGAFVWLIRTFSSYPEGVMFAVLLMNAMVPLLNRWSVPVPVGGPTPATR